MRFGLKNRSLSDPEKALALRVFKPTLPRWSSIGVTDSLGFGDRPWTQSNDNLVQLGGPHNGPYWLNLGPVCYPDCTSKMTFGGFGTIDAIFVHEMTHIWQYFHGYYVILSSIWGQTLGDGYDYTLGKSWNDYNVEQQASIVEDWYTGGMDTSDDRFPYIDKVLRRGGGPGSSMTLDDLNAWTP